MILVYLSRTKDLNCLGHISYSVGADFSIVHEATDLRLAIERPLECLWSGVKDRFCGPDIH